MALYREDNRYIWKEKFYPDNYECELIDQNDVIYDDDGEKFPIIGIDLQMGYFDAEGDNEELTNQCSKALANIENWDSDIIPALKNLRLVDVSYDIVNEHYDVWGARGYTLRIYVPILEVSTVIEPFYLDDEIETAPDNKYVVLGKRLNNITNAQLFKNAIKDWAKATARK